MVIHISLITKDGEFFHILIALWTSCFGEYLLNLANAFIKLYSSYWRSYWNPLPPSSFAFSLSQHQCLFQWASSSHQVAKVFELQRQFLQSNPRDCNLPSSSVRGIPKQEILEWIAIPFSRASSRAKGLNTYLCVSWVGRQILYHCATLEVQ